MENDKNEFKIITLCGSTNFKEEFLETAQKLTLEGYIVLMPHVFVHSMATKCEKSVLEKLAKMHRQMMDMSEAILVVNKDGYIGESAKSEIEYAKKKDKKIYYMNIECKKDCRNHVQNICKGKNKLPFCKKKFSDRYPTCPYYVPSEKE